MLYTSEEVEYMLEVAYENGYQAGVDSVLGLEA